MGLTTSSGLARTHRRRSKSSICAFRPIALFLSQCSRISYAIHRYIAKMDGPSKLVGNRTVIHSPYNPDGSKKEWQWASFHSSCNILSCTHTLIGIKRVCGERRTRDPRQWRPDVPHLLSLRLLGSVLQLVSAPSWPHPERTNRGDRAIMGLNRTDLDPLDPVSWWVNDDGPVFTKSESTVGVGHASFTADTVSSPHPLAYFQLDRLAFRMAFRTSSTMAGTPTTRQGGDRGRCSHSEYRRVSSYDQAFVTSILYRNFTFNSDGMPVFPSPGRSTV